MPFFDALSAVLPAGRIVRDPDVIAASSRDQAAWAPQGRAAALVRPQDPEQVRAVVTVCAEHRVPVVTRGAGTGLSWPEYARRPLMSPPPSPRGTRRAPSWRPPAAA
ncbi:FAD-binding protein, partial [Nonomuraea sp. NPDC055795]